MTAKRMQSGDMDQIAVLALVQSNTVLVEGVGQNSYVLLNLTTIKFGALKVTPRVCYSRPPTEQPKTTSFVEVDEIDEGGGTISR